MLALVALLASPGDLGEAQAYVNQAAQLFQRSDFAGALTALRKAEPIAAQANDGSLGPIRFNIARCLEELGQKAAALDAYRAYLKVPDEGHRKQRAVQAIATLEKAVTATMTVSCQPVGAAVVYDGPSSGSGACPLTVTGLEPGGYRIRVSFAGHADHQQTVELAAGQTAPITVRLQARPVASPTTPAVTAAAAEPEGPSGPVWPWIAIGGGALVAGAGVFFTLDAIGQRDDAEKLPPSARRDSAVDDYEQAELLSWVGYGVGAAAIIGGALGLALQDDSAPQAWRFTGNGVQVRW